MAPNPDSTTAAALDDVFDNYLIGSDEEDPFRDLDTSLKLPAQSTTTTKRKTLSDDEGNDLNIDKEIQITKKRKPVPKLDEDRLLSQLGLPKLKSSFRSKLAPKLKGKGHEFSDAARLLQFYQLWLDALYPRAKFVDALAMVEKTGHSKRMQTMRKEWIDDGKRKTGDYMDETQYRSTALDGMRPAGVGQLTEGENRSLDHEQHDNARSGALTEDSLFVPVERNPGEDELDELLAQGIPDRPGKEAKEIDSEGEDDLDALFTSNAYKNAGSLGTAETNRHNGGEGEEDDLEAMLSLHYSRRPDALRTPKTGTDESQSMINSTTLNNPDDDDLTALLAEEQPMTEAIPPSPSTVSPDHAATSETEEDEIDALLSENPLRSTTFRPSPQAGDVTAPSRPVEVPDKPFLEAIDYSRSTTNDPGMSHEMTLEPAILSSSPIKNPEKADLDEEELDEMFA